MTVQVPPRTTLSLSTILSLSTVLSRLTRLTLPSGTAEDYTLSRPTERIDYFVSHTWHAGRPAKFLVRIAPTNPRLTLNLTLSLSLTLTMALTLARALALTPNQVLWLFFRQPSMLTHTPRRRRAAAIVPYVPEAQGSLPQPCAVLRGCGGRTSLESVYRTYHVLCTVRTAYCGATGCPPPSLAPSRLRASASYSL